MRIPFVIVKIFCHDGFDTDIREFTHLLTAITTPRAYALFFSYPQASKLVFPLGNLIPHVISGILKNIRYLSFPFFFQDARGVHVYICGYVCIIALVMRYVQGSERI